MLENNKVMLIYGLNDEDKEALSSIVRNEKLPEYRIIKPEMADMKLRDILDGLKFEIFGAALPEEKIILFNNFTDEELHKTITIIRNTVAIRPILAVITPTSIEWSFRYLLEHLIEEREWHRKTEKRGI